MIRSPRFLKIKSASILIGAFLCLLLPACNEKKSTAEWKNSASEPTQRTVDTTEKAQPRAPTDKTSKASTPRKTGDHKNVRFVAYNLKNYLTMKRYTNGKSEYTSKPEEEITALIDIIHSSHPDILGVCEIGSPNDLKDLQARLKKAGTDLPHIHQVLEYDKVRTLAILSRYPIIATDKPKQDSYQLNNRQFKISRGILDATIQLPKWKVRFLGAHFKSKRPIREADQELMRRNESLLFRKHIDDILTTAPDTRILAYGDFNDTKRTKSVYTVRGRANSRTRMEMIEAKDSRGENWTHNWKREDIYSRFDFVMTNLKLSPHINNQESKILDPKNWELASDHRALLVLIK